MFTFYSYNFYRRNYRLQEYTILKVYIYFLIISMSASNLFKNCLITAITFYSNQNVTKELIRKAHFRYLHVKHKTLYTRRF